MNRNSVKVGNAHKNKTRKYKKSKSSKNELLHLSVKSSKTLLKAMQVAKEEVEYIKKYYQYNVNGENLDNEDDHLPISLSHCQQQFLKVLLKQNHKNHERYSNNLHSNSNLYPSMNIPSCQSLHSSYPSYINNNVENNHNNISFKNEATVYPKNNISASSSYPYNNHYNTNNTNNKNNRLMPNNYPLPQQYQIKSSNFDNTTISNNNTTYLPINNNNFQYKTQNISMLTERNTLNKDKMFIKKNNNVKDTTTNKGDITLKNNNINNTNIESNDIDNGNRMKSNIESNMPDNKSIIFYY